jgi:hypothetical protein
MNISHAFYVIRNAFGHYSLYIRMLWLAAVFVIFIPCLITPGGHAVAQLVEAISSFDGVIGIFN